MSHPIKAYTYIVHTVFENRMKKDGDNSGNNNSKKGQRNGAKHNFIRSHSKSFLSFFLFNGVIQFFLSFLDTFYNMHTYLNTTTTTKHNTESKRNKKKRNPTENFLAGGDGV